MKPRTLTSIALAIAAAWVLGLLLAVVTTAVSAAELRLQFPGGECRLTIDGEVLFDQSGDVGVAVLPDAPPSQFIICGTTVDPGPGCAPGPKPVWQAPSAERNNFERVSGDTFAELFGPWPVAPENRGSVYRFDIPSALTMSLPLEITGPGAVLLTWEGSTTGSMGATVSVSRVENGVFCPVTPECISVGSSSGGTLKIGAGELCDPGPGSYWLNVSDVDQRAENTCSLPACEFLVRVQARIPQRKGAAGVSYFPDLFTPAVTCPVAELRGDTFTCDGAMPYTPPLRMGPRAWFYPSTATLARMPGLVAVDGFERGAE